jgi:uncharacterized YccA/Bax inhibitor family protein
MFKNSVLANANVINARAVETDGVLTSKGVRNKVLISLGVATLSAIFTMTYFARIVLEQVSLAFTGSASSGIILGLAVVLTLVFGIYNAFHMTKPSVIAIIGYCIFEGVLIGIISITFEILYPGIVFQALLGTAGVTWISAILSKKLSDTTLSKMRKIVMVALPAYVLFALVNLVISFATGVSLYSGGWGILVSLFAIALGAVMLVNDFDTVSKMEGQAPSIMEWSCAYAIVLDIIWIFLELLRLLANSKGRK